MSVPIPQQSDLAYTLTMVIDILNDLGTDYAAAIADSLRMGDLHAALESPFPEPRLYTCANVFSRDYLAYNLLRKLDIEIPCVDRVGAAVTAFMSSEASCRLVNQYGHNPLNLNYGIYPTSNEALMYSARKLIAKVLGEFSWVDGEKGMGFSGGATTRLPRKSGAPFYKYQGKPEVTHNCAMLAVSAIASIPLWSGYMVGKGARNPEDWVTVVPGSKATTVPKTWKTDRFICLEPDANMLLQRGIGSRIRTLLKKKCGIDLDSQVYNQELARIGSVTGSLSTIDLKAASDSVSLRLVCDLLPTSWVDAILSTRSKYTLIGDKYVRLEKVSSMGNGFTFELETLIFWALAKTVLDTYGTEDRRLAVYGDDIVIHNSAAAPLICLLDFCGFTTNDDKTFVSGPFRESCGKHYFYGVDVSPFNIKSVVDCEARFYTVINAYNEWIGRNLDKYPKGALRMLRSGRKFTHRFCIVPPEYGDDAGIRTCVTKAARVVWSMRKQAYLFKVLRPVRQIHRPNGVSALIAWLASAGDELSERILELHKGDAVYKRFSASTSRWGSFTP